MEENSEVKRKKMKDFLCYREKKEKEKIVLQKRGKKVCYREKGRNMC